MKRISKKTYLSESHKRISEACQKAVAEMARHPLSFEQKLKQIEDNRRRSSLGGDQDSLA